MSRDRPVAQRRARGHFVSEDVVVPLIEQLRHRHLHVGSGQTVIEFSLELLEFKNHLGPGLRWNGLPNYTTIAIAPDCHYAEPARIGRPLINRTFAVASRTCNSAPFSRCCWRVLGSIVVR